MLTIIVIRNAVGAEGKLRNRRWRNALKPVDELQTRGSKVDRNTHSSAVGIALEAAVAATVETLERTGQVAAEVALAASLS